MSDFSWNVAKPTYTSRYQSTIDDLLNKISTREEFSYDFNADPLYQQYKDQYTKLGNEASMNAAANVSALTGGYGNSYAATAASQANQQYLTQLNNMIPELYNAALNKYQMESEDLYNKYGAFGDAEDRDYGHYRDAVSDWYNDRSFAYSMYRDDVSDSQWQQTYDYNKYVNDRNYNYQVSQDQKNYDYQVAKDQVSQDQWNKTFAYQQQRDAVSDSQWQQTFDLSKQKAASSGSGSGSKKEVDVTQPTTFSQWLELQKYNDSKAEKETAQKESQYDDPDTNAAVQQSMIRYDHKAKSFNDVDEGKDYINSLYEDELISYNQAKELLRNIGY